MPPRGNEPTTRVRHVPPVEFGELAPKPLIKSSPRVPSLRPGCHWLPGIGLSLGLTLLEMVQENDRDCVAGATSPRPEKPKQSVARKWMVSRVLDLFIADLSAGL